MALEHVEVFASAGKGPGQRVLTCRGAMTMETLTPLRLALQAENASVLILVLVDVPHMDSAGLGLLLHLHASCQRTGRRLALAGLNERIRTSLDATGISQVLTLYSTRADAEQALS
jgi:anti-anti-sigma factor